MERKKKKTLEELAEELVNAQRYGHPEAIGDTALADTVEFEPIPPMGPPPDIPPTLRLVDPLVPEQGWSYTPPDTAA